MPSYRRPVSQPDGQALKRSRIPRRQRGAVCQLRQQQPRRTFAPIELLSAEQLEAVHRASLKILRDTGLEFFSDATRAFLGGQPGVTVDEDTRVVRFDPEMVEEAIGTIPSRFRLHARNPDRHVDIGEVLKVIA